jgi:hypothetical protein
MRTRPGNSEEGLELEFVFELEFEPGIMAKKFLETLGEAFSDDVLTDLIPTREQKPVRRKRSEPVRKPKKKKSSGRGKRFTDQIDQQMKENRPVRKKSVRSSTPKRKNRKSFLDTIEEAFDSKVFDEIIPDNPSWQRKRVDTPKQIKEAQERFSTMITKEVLDRAREIAKIKGIRVKDVINAALKYYIEKVEV